MARLVRWSLVALNDLEAAAQYIEHDSRFYAASLVSEVFDAAETLAFLPEGAAIVPEFNNPNVREIFIKGYRLIFRVTKRTVSILAFVHGARDLRTFWDDSERTLEE